MAKNEDAIREVAYTMWKQAGEPSGEDLRFWYAAEQELDCCGDMTSEDAELGKGPDKAGAMSTHRPEIARSENRPARRANAGHNT